MRCLSHVLTAYGKPILGIHNNKFMNSVVHPNQLAKRKERGGPEHLGSSVNVRKYFPDAIERKPPESTAYGFGRDTPYTGPFATFLQPRGYSKARGLLS